MAWRPNVWVMCINIIQIRVGIVPSRLSSGVLGRTGRDSIDGCRPQNIVRRPSDELETNRDGFLDHSDDTRRFDIVLKVVEDDIVRQTDELDARESNQDVTG